MGLLDKFTTKPPAPEARPTPKTFAIDRTKMFDLTQTQVLAELFAVPPDQRKAAWQGAFFTALWNASLEIGTPPVFTGPDSFHYLRMHLPAPATPFDSNSVANQAQHALDSGLGIAIFASPSATEPEYVLSMGVLDSLVTYDTWLGDPIDVAEWAKAPPQAPGIQTLTTTKDQQILVGSPSPSLLPPHTARALYRHLNEAWHIPEPRIALMMNPEFTLTRSLVINRKLSEFPDEKTASRQCGMLLWYFPPRRGLLLMPESWKQEDMRKLTDFFPQP